MHTGREVGRILVSAGPAKMPSHEYEKSGRVHSCGVPSARAAIVPEAIAL